MAANVTKVRLFNKPFNPNGLYTLSFSSASDRESYFGSGAVVSFNNGNYARKDGTLTVGACADTLDSLGVNYVAFQNTAFGNKWFYAFVRKIEYINQSTSRLYIETDVFMTYQFDVENSSFRNDVFVERETVSATEDNAINNIIPEPVACNGYEKHTIWEGRYQTDTQQHFENSFYIAVVVSTMNITGDTDNDKAKSVLNTGAHYIDGCPLGGSLIAVKNLTDFGRLIECITVLNGNIISVFPLQKSRLNGATPLNVAYETVDANSGDPVTYNFDVFTTGGDVPSADTVTLQTGKDNPQASNFSPWSGYTVRNKKLFTYPYVFLVGDNHNGSEAIYRYDLFANDTAEFTVRFVSCPDCCIAVRPENYEGTSNIENGIINSNFPKIPFEINEYSRYNAQHYNSLVFGAKATALNWGLSFGRDLLSLGMGSQTATYTENAGGDIVGGKFTETTGTPSGLISGTVSAIESIQATRESLKDMQGLGNSVHNVPSGNLLGVWGELGVAIHQKHVTLEDAKRIDSFFDRYGYEVDRIEPLSWKRRTNYDYIKTRGCNVTGVIPADDKRKLNALFDAGITIWHSYQEYGRFASDGHPNTAI